MKEEVAPRKIRLAMEEELDIIRYDIQDHHERKRSFQDDNNEQQKRRDIDNSQLRSVRRKLFSDDGDDQQERENINNRISEERRQQMEEAKKKWDFDFERGKPVEQPIRYEWVQLDEQGNEILRDK